MNIAIYIINIAIYRWNPFNMGCNISNCNRKERDKGFGFNFKRTQKRSTDFNKQRDSFMYQYPVTVSCVRR